jgi:hypothetical protein
MGRLSKGSGPPAYLAGTTTRFASAIGQRPRLRLTMRPRGRLLLRSHPDANSATRAWPFLNSRAAGPVAGPVAGAVPGSLPPLPGLLARYRGARNKLTVRQREKRVLSVSCWQLSEARYEGPWCVGGHISETPSRSRRPPGFLGRLVSFFGTIASVPRLNRVIRVRAAMRRSGPHNGRGPLSRMTARRASPLPLRVRWHPSESLLPENRRKRRALAFLPKYPNQSQRHDATLALCRVLRVCLSSGRDACPGSLAPLNSLCLD